MNNIQSRKLIWGIEIILCLLFSAVYAGFIAYGFRTSQNVYAFIIGAFVTIVGAAAVIALFRPSVIQALLFPILSLLYTVVFDVILYLMRLEDLSQFLFQMLVYLVYSGLLILYALYRKGKLSGNVTVLLMFGISALMLITVTLSTSYRPGRSVIFQNIQELLPIGGILFVADLLALLFSCFSRTRKGDHYTAAIYFIQWIYLFFCVYILHFLNIL